MNHSHSVVTRFAPSPTGWLHVGGVRTALYAWLWAKKNKGSFILRIEDTDKEREVAGSMEHIIESLTWLGVNFDQGPNVGGPYEPYIQSLRLPLYRKYADILIEKGFAYADPYTQEELDAFRTKADEEKRPFLFRDHRPSIMPPWDGTKPLRFKTPIKQYSWNDVVRGDLSAGVEAVDDFILIKSDGYPTYNFAHIVDDIEMQVTHVMRGEEFISSTPKFLAIYEALELTPPIFVTMPPILGPSGNKKLSKRDGAKDILEYRNEGYLPSAIVNFLALLGWNPGGDAEIFTIDEIIEKFDITRIQKSGAQFDDKKLVWINREHMKKLSYEEQEEFIDSYIPAHIKQQSTCTNELIHKLVPVIMERIEKFSDVTSMFENKELDFFFTKPKLDVNKISLKDIDKKETIHHLSSILSSLNAVENWEIDSIKQKIMEYADTLPKRGPALHPLRFSLSGLDQSPDPFIISSIIGKEETLSRIGKAIDTLAK
ncbi:MAG: glutamate--tRNA ligase [Candidatus Pacebacteria bacterium]|nr:glutamate--tRNA ligase [Candidatus Paceibacterota bacterium]